MAEKKIVININETGSIEAETFGMKGTECIDELDKLMKDIALSATHHRKKEFYDQETSIQNTVKNQND